MKHIELHVLHTVSPNRANRDQNGQPKVSILGGVPRTRFSSQSQKRRQRNLKDTMRTRVPHLVLSEQLSDELKPLAFDLMVNRYGAADDAGRLKTSTYLSQAEYSAFAQALQKEGPRLLTLKGDTSKSGVKAYEAALSEISASHKPVTSEDHAVFGRFMADVGDETVQAASSYGHAFSVHRENTISDFFTQVDDHEKRDGNDQSAVSHLGEMGLSAPTLYRFATLDLDLLSRNLPQYDETQIKQVVADWVRGFMFAIPEGGSHGAYGQTLPEYVLITTRDSGQPINLGNAFSEPAYPRDGQTLLHESVRKLKEQAAYNNRAFGQNGLSAAAEISLRDLPNEDFPVQRHASLDAALHALGF